MNLTAAIITIIASAIGSFGLLHASIWGIGGGHSYSLYYQSHHLIKRKGLIKVIYFKPKFFHRYSFDEVLYFFAAYFSLPLGIAMLTLTLTKTIEPQVGAMISLSYYLFFFLYEFFRIIINEIFRLKEDRYFKQQEREALKSYDYSTLDEKIMKSYAICLAKISKRDEAAIEKLDEEYISYIRNYKKVKIEKEKTDGSFIFNTESN